ncbi:hypothetical protein [Achromobacter aloeverae]|uniref:Lipoprotein n=1 Tax=Achromobacter aloeverae TaxID=1750518 RepID=A0A4Q1HLB2_9BURK|nr:hypothetical protein [Achromobacter aloeverae]RXN90425.1 hypothetical protein C7R54_13050 [Achromobacter aloeverae]
MKSSRLYAVLLLATACASGAAMAQPTTPSTTPNDSTATPPNNTKVPEGTPAPAPNSGAPTITQPVNRDTSNSDLKNENGMPRKPSDPGNTNVTPTQGGGAPYPNRGNK